MAWYSYKQVAYNIPASFQRDFEKKFKEEYGREYEGTSDYDGDLWHLVAAYIDHLQALNKVTPETTLDEVAAKIVYIARQANCKIEYKIERL